MIHGWKELLTYRHDGRYDIDNTEAERKIRPLTIVRKNTYSSVARRMWKSPRAIIGSSKLASLTAWLG